MIDITGIRKKAKTLGIAGTKMKKNELILAIQEAEGNFPCFKTASGNCDQTSCLWRDDCIESEN